MGTGESIPDTALLPDVALILNTSVDELLGAGSCCWIYKKRITVERMNQALDCVEQLHNLLGTDHYMYRTMVDALDTKMNSSIEQTFGNKQYKDAYVCEAILECVKNGGYIDLDDIRINIASEKSKKWTLNALREMGLK